MECVVVRIGFSYVVSRERERERAEWEGRHRQLGVGAWWSAAGVEAAWSIWQFSAGSAHLMKRVACYHTFAGMLSHDKRTRDASHAQATIQID